MTNSTCYQQAACDPKTGIVVHSTGVNQTRIARYVQPSNDDPKKDEIIADIGKNRYNNDWNHVTAYKGVHAFIGENDHGQVEVYQVLPYEKDAWGVASGKNGSYNYKPNARIQFEICEDALTSQQYFDECFNSAIEYCAMLCNEYGWDESKICSHREAYLAGMGSQHGDPDHWLKKFGKDMDWFRAEVKKLLKPMPTPEKYKRGDKVVMSPDATKYSSGKTIPAWVKATKPLYIVEDSGDTCVISVNSSLAVTGRVYKKDLSRYEEPYIPVKEHQSVKMPVLQERNKVEAVKTAKIILNAKGYKGKDGKELTINDIFDANLTYAVTSYQEDQCLCESGLIDGETWESLLLS